MTSRALQRKMAARLSSTDFTNLQLLLKAPCKDVVRDVCVQSYEGPSVPLTETTATVLNIPVSQSSQLVQSIHVLSHHILFHGLSSAQQILDLFPDWFHPNLKNLITKILLENGPTWKTEAAGRHVSLPQLKGVAWRVAMVTGSDSVGGTSGLSFLLQLQVKDPCPSAVVSTVTVELSRDSVDTILDGLGRIREQLSAVAAK